VSGVETAPLNRLSITATLVEVMALRYTPAGIPAIDAVLEHASGQVEAGQVRQVALRIRAVAFGAMAESLARLSLGTPWICHGFLTNTRNGKGIVFHLQDFNPI